MVTGHSAYQSAKHTEACRVRIEKAMRENESFRHTVERADLRMAQRLAEVLEKRHSEEKKQSSNEAKEDTRPGGVKRHRGEVEEEVPIVPGDGSDVARIQNKMAMQRWRTTWALQRLRVT